MLTKRSVLLLLALLPAIGMAQVSFVASPAVINASVNQSFNITYTLKGGATEKYSPPDFGSFRIISTRTSSGGSQSLVNGKVIAGAGYTETWTYTLRSDKPGNYKIPSAKVLVKGTWFTSNAVNVTVAVNSSVNTNSKPNGTQPRNNQQPSNQHAKAQSIDAFVRATCDRTQVYQGEPVIVSFKIYTTAEQAQYTMNKSASYDGFWSEELIDPQVQKTPTTEFINGQQYMVGEIRRIALYPQKSGLLRIEPQEVEAILKTTAKIDASGMFDDFFSDPFSWDPFNSPFFQNPMGNVSVSYDTRKIKSNPLDIKVITMPTEGMPDDFINAVGQYTIKAWLDKNKCKTGEAVTLKFRISGKGNLKLIEAPLWDLPVGIDSYEPETDDKLQKTLTGIEGDRVFSYTLIPSSGGEYSIGPFSFSYFDPQIKRYVTQTTDTFRLSVSGANTKNGIDNAGIAQDIRNIHKDGVDLRKIDSYLFSLWWFWALYSIPVLILMVLIIVLRRRIRIRQDVVQFRNRMALRVATKRLKTAQKLLMVGNDIAFYQEISRALWLFSTDKLAIPISELSIESVRQSIGIAFGDELATRFSDLLKECEYARFAPVDKAINMLRLYEQAKQLIMDFQTKR